jgi:hypothetical protein
MDLLPEEVLHPAALVTVTESVTVPDAGALNAIILVPLPAVMVPLVMLHA